MAEITHSIRSFLKRAEYPRVDATEWIMKRDFDLIAKYVRK